MDQELYLYHPNGSHFTSHTKETIRANEEARVRQIEKQRADIAEEKLIHLHALLKEKGISLDE